MVKTKSKDKILKAGRRSKKMIHRETKIEQTSLEIIPATRQKSNSFEVVKEGNCQHFAEFNIQQKYFSKMKVN